MIAPGKYVRADPSTTPAAPIPMGPARNMDKGILKIATTTDIYS